jgi:hypothetical protein
VKKLLNNIIQQWIPCSSIMISATHFRKFTLNLTIPYLVLLTKLEISMMSKNYIRFPTMF